MVKLSPGVGRVFAGLLALGLAAAAVAADLPRRPSLGIELVPAAEPGVRIASVPAGLRWQGPPLHEGDVLTSIGGKPVASPAEVTPLLQALGMGATASLEARRDGTRLGTAARVVPAPIEQPGDFRIDYLTVSVAEGRRRAVLTRPTKGGPHPAVLIIGGLGCYPVDQPFNPNEAQRALAHALTRAGHATLRVETSGAGDSEGAPCAGTGMDTEVAGLVAGLRQLKQRPDIDANRVVILGISMGGIVGPRVAAEEKVAGLLMYEIVGGTSWFEYELENRRRQLALRGEQAPAIHQAVMTRAWCLMQVMVDGQARERVIAARPACERELRYPVGDRYMRDVFAANIPRLYTTLGPIPVRLVYGSADFITSRAQHEGLADAINAAHPGSASFAEIDGMDHWLSRAADPRASFDRAVSQGRFIDQFHDGAAQLAIDWLRQLFRIGAPAVAGQPRP